MFFICLKVMPQKHSQNGLNSLYSFNEKHLQLLFISFCMLIILLALSDIVIESPYATVIKSLLQISKYQSILFFISSWMLNYYNKAHNSINALFWTWLSLYSYKRILTGQMRLQTHSFNMFFTTLSHFKDIQVAIFKYNCIIYNFIVNFLK